jgi:hypothetical protein
LVDLLVVLLDALGGQEDVRLPILHALQDLILVATEVAKLVAVVPYRGAD